MTLKNSTTKFIKEVHEIKSLFKTDDWEVIRVIYSWHLMYGISYQDILELENTVRKEDLNSNVCYSSNSTPTYQAMKLILEAYQHDKEN